MLFRSYTFSSEEKIEKLKDVFDILLGSMGIVYFMMPYEPDKMSYWLEPEVENYLFHTDKKTEKPLLDNEITLKVQNLLFGDPDLEDKVLKPKPKKLTLDNLLDKIIDCGKDSLTKEEKEMLNEYSKK